MFFLFLKFDSRKSKAKRKKKRKESISSFYIFKNFKSKIQKYLICKLENHKIKKKTTNIFLKTFVVL